MTRFHRGPGGNPAPCNATKRACPVGGSHWDSLEEAAQALMKREVERAPALRIVTRAEKAHGARMAEAHSHKFPMVERDQLSKAFTTMVMKQGWSEAKVVRVLTALTRRGLPVDYKHVLAAGEAYDHMAIAHAKAESNTDDAAALRQDFHALTE